MIRMSRQEETRQSGLIAGLELAGMSPSERPDAVFCFNDVTAEGVLFGLRRAGLKTPHDVAVVGMDGIPSAQFLDVPLTTVHLPTDILCREAVRILQQRIHQGGNSQPQQVVVPAYLVAGDTA
jgi:LacI family transcriptional regulator